MGRGDPLLGIRAGDPKGKLYGTMEYAGAYSFGTVFEPIRFGDSEMTCCSCRSVGGGIRNSELATRRICRSNLCADREGHIAVLGATDLVVPYPIPSTCNGAPVHQNSRANAAM